MNKNSYPNFNAPSGFQEILHDFAKEVLRYQPKDIIEFGADYFETRHKGESLENDLKYIKILQAIKQKQFEEVENDKKFLMMKSEKENAVHSQKEESKQITKENDSQNKSERKKILPTEESDIKDLIKSPEDSSIRALEQRNDISLISNRTHDLIKGDELFNGSRVLVSARQQEDIKDVTKDSNSMNIHSISTMDHSVAAVQTHTKDQKSQPVLKTNEFKEENKTASAQILKKKTNEDLFLLPKEEGMKEQEKNNAKIPSKKIETNEDKKSRESQREKNHERNEEKKVIEENAAIASNKFQMHEKHEIIEENTTIPSNKFQKNEKPEMIEENTTISSNVFQNNEDKKSRESQRGKNYHNNEKPDEKEDQKHQNGGVLKINVISLRWEESPSDLDLLVSLQLLKHSEQKELQTKKVRKTHTPEWSFDENMALKLSEIKEKNLKLRITLKNCDNLAEPIKLASKDLDLTEVFQNDNKWAINNYIELNIGETGNSPLPMLYIQIRWLWQDKIYPDTDSQPMNINELEKTIMQQIFEPPKIDSQPIAQPIFNEEKMVQGQLQINIIKARNLVGGESNPYCECWLAHEKNKKLQTNPHLKTLNPEWNVNFELKLENLKMSEIQSNHIIFGIKSADFIHDDFLGGISLSLKEIIENNGKWTNGWLKLTNENCSKPECGEIYLQICFFDGLQMREPIPPINDTQIIEINNVEKIIEQPIFGENIAKGQIQVNIIKARNLIGVKLEEGRNSYCELWLSHDKNKKLQTKVISKSLNPIWNENLILKLDTINVGDLSNVKMFLDIKSADFIHDDILGGIRFNLKELIENDGKWINDWFKLTNEDCTKPECGEIYLQISFFDGSRKTEPIPIIDSQPIQHISEENVIKGQLQVNVIKARNFMGVKVENCDPYCELWFSYDKKQKIKTKTLSKTLSPNWNETHVLKIDDLKGIYFESAIFELAIKNYDMLGQDEDLGGLGFNLKEMVENNGKWVNGWFNMTNIKGVCGEIYLQICFFDGSQTIEPAPLIKTSVDLNDMEKSLSQINLNEEKVKGNLEINIIKARNLMGVEKDCEPYCELYLSHEKNEKIKTKTLSKTLTPQWNENHILKIDNLNVNELDSVKILLGINNSDIAHETFLGGISLYLKEMIEKQGKWINGWFKLSNESSLNPDCGEIYLQISFFDDLHTREETPSIMD